MSGFTEDQLKELRGRLHRCHVATRQQNGIALSFVEGWFTISEANRIFGYDGWDRETVETSCVWQGKVQGSNSCCYSARVRVIVHAGEKTTITREGCGFGTGSGATPGEAHEKALKEAETDAMKRALVTFGNRFGLALYDREQRGVSGPRRPKEAPWPVHAPGVGQPTPCPTPQAFYAELRKRLESLTSAAEVRSLWSLNETTLRTIREHHRELVDRAGAHYTAVFARLCRERAKQLEPLDPPHPALETAPSSPDTAPPGPGIDKSALTIGTPKRIRNKDHLRSVAAQPCLICGRTPAQAHHLAYLQPRARGLKTSDEWTVPLCALHHRQLHDRGNEWLFWEEHRLDPETFARALWAGTRSGADPDVPSGHQATPSESQVISPSVLDETRFMLDPPAGEGDVEPPRE